MDVTYRFIASGAQDVEKAFTGIEKAAVRQKQAVEQATRSTSRAFSAGGGGGGAAGGRRPVSETERLAQRVAAAQERQAQREVRAAERAAQAKTRADAKANLAKTRADEKAATAAVRVEERAAKAKVRIEERNRAYVARIRDKHFADEQRRGEREERDKIRRTERAAQEAARKEEAARKRAEGERAAKRKQSIGVLKDLASGAFLGTVGAGAALIGSAARESMDLQETSARIAISARGAGEKARDAGELRRGFERTAMATPGQSAAGIADAVQRFVSLTGDLDTAIKSQGTFATIASASGANVGDVAEAAASLSEQFDVKGIDEMRDALAALTFQGKHGAFELKDAAAQFQRLAASGASFGIPKGVGGVKILGGLTQIARKGTGSAEQATTAVENLLTNLKTKQTQLGGAGVKVFDKAGKARDVRDLIVESISKVGGKDMAKKAAGLTQIFGEQGIRAINPLIAKYGDTFRSTKGTDVEKTAAAVAMLRAELQDAIDAPGTFADAEEDAALAQKQASAQLSAAWEALKSKTADALIPSLGKLAESLAGKESLLDPFIEAVGLAAEAVVWFAEATGFKKKKTKTDELADAQKALDAYKQKNHITDATIGPVSPAQAALEDKVAAANEALFSSNAPKGPMGAADFVTKYMAANNMGEDRRQEAETLAQRLRNKDGGGLQANDWLQEHLYGETTAGRDVRHQYQGDVKYQQSAAAIDTKDAQVALQSFANSVAAANAKIAASQQGSIVTGV